MKYWDKIEYQKIINANFHEDEIKVEFQNGDVISLLYSSLLSADEDIVEGKIRNNGFSIELPCKSGYYSVPWDKIRILTDPSFANHMAMESEKYSKRIGKRVRVLREKAGIKSMELAKRSGLTPQTISRIENGQSDVGMANLFRILTSMGYGLKDLTDEGYSERIERKFSTVLSKLNKAGIDPSFILEKVVPYSIYEKLVQNKEIEPVLLQEEAVSYIGSVFGWSNDEIWNKQKLELSEFAFQKAYFKKSSNSNINQIKAYSHYVYFLAKTIVKACDIKTPEQHPKDIYEFKNQYYNKYKTMNFLGLVSYAWDLGICILPLDDSGVFHGACWNIDGKDVIILKQKNRSRARWIYDLLHEIYHVLVHLDEDNIGLIEFDEIDPFSGNDQKELEANVFANQVLFGEDYSQLPELCVERANWDLSKLKKAVKDVAKEKEIEKDMLANLIAFRLSNQGQNWWGTANNFQIIAPDPYEEALKFLRSKMNTKFLSSFEDKILNMALES